MDHPDRNPRGGFDGHGVAEDGFDDHGQAEGDGRYGEHQAASRDNRMMRSMDSLDRNPRDDGFDGHGLAEDGFDDHGSMDRPDFNPRGDGFDGAGPAEEDLKIRSMDRLSNSSAPVGRYGESPAASHDNRRTWASDEPPVVSRDNPPGPPPRGARPRSRP